MTSSRNCFHHRRDRTELLFDRRVDCLVHVPLMVEIADDIHERICDDHESRLSQLEREIAELREKLE